MSTVYPYLNLGGRCREAMELYRSCFGGELNVMTFADAGIDIPDAARGMIIHSELRAGAFVLNGSDGRLDQPAPIAGNVSLNVQFEDEAQQTRVFDLLAAGGRVDMPLSDTFWGARAGFVTDRFGIAWMLNWQKPKSSQSSNG